MPKFQVTAPDGFTYEITAPDGASESDALSHFQSQWQPKQQKPQIEEPTGLNGFAVGMGKGMNDVARGVGELVGHPNWTGIEPYKPADDAINNSTSGTIGQVVGNMVATSPAMLIPGANTLVGGAAIGAGTGALTTEGDLGKRLESGAMGGVGGLVGGALPYAVNLLDKIAAPFGSTATKEKAVGRALNHVVGSDSSDAISRLENTFSNVPGTQLTAGEVANNGGLSGLQNFISDTAEGSSAFKQRELDNWGARQSALGGVAGNESRMNAAKQARNDGTASDYATIHDTKVQSDADLERILGTNAGKSAVANARKLASNEYRQFGEKTPFANESEQQAFVSTDPIIAASRTHWTQQPIDYERDNMLTAIRKLGGINKDLAQQTYGNEMWRDGLGNGLFRNNGGMSLDDMAMRLHEHGYLDASEANPNDLAMGLYRGGGNEMFSNGKQSFDNVYSAPGPSEKDLLMERLGRLTDAIEKQNAPKKRIEPVKADPSEISYYGKDLHNINRSLGAAAADRNIDPVLRQSIGNVYGDFQSALEQKIPGLLDVNTRYKELSQPINQMEAGQELLNRLNGNKSNHVTPGKEQKDQYLRALDDVKGTFLKKTLKGGANYSSLDELYSPEQMAIINGIGEDLQRKSSHEFLASSRGSNTSKNLSMNGIAEAAGIPSYLSGAFQLAGAIPGVGLLNVPVNAVKKLIVEPAYDSAEKRMKGILSDALLNPKEAARIMKEGKKRGLLDVANDHKKYGGLLGMGVSNTIQNQRD